MISSVPGRMTPLWSAALLACGALLPAWAQDSTPALPPDATPTTTTAAAAGPRTAADLAEAVEAAWQRAAESREAEALRRRAEAGRIVVGSTWAAPPAFELSRREKRWDGGAGQGSETEAGLALPLWMPDQREARLAVSDAEGRLAGAAARAGRLQIAGRVREAAWRIAAEQALHETQAAQAGLFERLAQDVQRRVAAGDLARADALAAQAEWLDAQEALAGAIQRLTEARSQWRVLAGLDDVPVPPATSGAPQATPQALPSLHPDLQLAELTVEHAQRNLDAVRKDRRDPPELLLRLRRDAPGAVGGSQNSVGIGVRIPFGTDARNAPLQAAALSAADSAQLALARTRERLGAAEQMARSGLRAAEAQHDASRTRAALLRERAGLVQRSFDAGETPLPELLRVLSAAAQAEAALARRQAALGLAQARLQQALGILP